jgi:hypothetical protein
MVIFLSCATKDKIATGNNIIKSEYDGKNGEMSNHLTTNDYVREIVKHLAFKGFGELM